MDYQSEKKERARRAAEKYRNSEKGKAYMAKWREENREHYLEYQRAQGKKRYQALKNAENK